MNMPNFDFNRPGCVAGLALLFFLPLPMRSYDGGGQPIVSPYSPEDSITLEKVTHQREIANTSMTMSWSSDGWQGTLNEVAVAWAEHGKVTGQASNQVKGITSAGETLGIDFSDIQEMSVFELEGLDSKPIASFIVQIFPDISPQELVRDRPTYSELKQNHIKQVSLRIALSNGRGADLCFVGTTSNGDRVSHAVKEFKKNTTLSFKYSGLEQDARQKGKWKGSGDGI